MLLHLHGNTGHALPLLHLIDSTVFNPIGFDLFIHQKK